MAEENGAPANGGAEGGQGSASVSLPKYVPDNLGKEVHEQLTKLATEDPEFAKSIPQTLPEFGKAWLSTRAQLSEISRKYKEAEEGRKPPNSPQDYGLEKSKLPEGMVYDKPFADAFQAKAHKLGLPVKAVQELYDWYSGFALERSKAIGEQQRKQEAEREATRARDLDQMKTALRIQWGDRYDSRMPRNVAALQNPTLIPTELSQRLDKAGFLRDPVFHLWWDRYVSMTTSDRKLGLPREEGDGTEEEANAAEATVVDKDGKRHLKPGFFASTAKRHPARKKAS